MANQFWELCENACIDVKYISVAHPKANGQVERGEWYDNRGTQEKTL
jgi:hypothetical protein